MMANDVNLNVRVPAKLRDRFNELAALQGYTASTLIRKWVENWIERAEEKRNNQQYLNAIIGILNADFRRLLNNHIDWKSFDEKESYNLSQNIVEERKELISETFDAELEELDVDQCGCLWKVKINEREIGLFHFDFAGEAGFYSHDDYETAIIMYDAHMDS